MQVGLLLEMYEKVLMLTFYDMLVCEAIRCYMDIQTLSLLKRTNEYFRERGQAAYVVGGSMRDLLLGEACSDWDIVSGRDAHGLARRLADRLGGFYGRMHDKASRVIVKADAPETDGASAITFDISPIQGALIEDDLRERDFTINAVAAPLDAVVQYMEAVAQGDAGAGDRKGRPYISLGGSIIDPVGGLQDIQARRLRVVGEDVFRHDPLRMLRAVRFMARYGLSLDGHTQGLMLRDAALLPTVAPERIHDELYAILEPEGATTQLHLLDSLGLLTILIPEFAPARDMPQPYPHYWDVLEHSLETVGALERVAALVGPPDDHASYKRAADAHDPDARTPHAHPPDAHEGHPYIWASPTTRPGGDDMHGDGGASEHVGMPLVGIRDSENIIEIRNILWEAEQQGIFSFAALTAPRMKLAALLHDIGKPETFSVGEDGGVGSERSIHFYNHPRVGAVLVERIMRRLSASTRDRRLAQQVAAHHMRPGQLGQDGPPTPRAIRRYFMDLGPTGILVALFSLADHLATFGPQPLTAAWERHLGVVRLLLASYVRERESILPPRLLSADELMRRLKLDPGPLVGQLLDEIAEAQAEGRVRSREEALWLAEERLDRGE